MKRLLNGKRRAASHSVQFALPSGGDRQESTMPQNRNLFSTNRAARIGTPLVVAALSLCVLLAGCGGGHHSSTDNATGISTESRASGRAVFTIVWPKRSTAPGRAIPANADEIRITFTDGGNNPVTVAGVTVDSGSTAQAHATGNVVFVNPPTGGGSIPIPTNITIVLPKGTLTATAQAFVSTDPNPTAIASAVDPVTKSTTFTIDPATDAAVTFDLTSTVNSLAITPAAVSLTVGDTPTLAAGAKNAAGSALLVDPNKILWGGGNAYVTVPPGPAATTNIVATKSTYVNGTSTGRTTITATFAEGSVTKTATATVDILPRVTLTSGPTPATGDTLPLKQSAAGAMAKASFTIRLEGANDKGATGLNFTLEHGGKAVDPANYLSLDSQTPVPGKDATDYTFTFTAPIAGQPVTALDASSIPASQLDGAWNVRFVSGDSVDLATNTSPQPPTTVAIDVSPVIITILDASGKPFPGNAVAVDQNGKTTLKASITGWKGGTDTVIFSAAKGATDVSSTVLSTTNATVSCDFNAPWSQNGTHADGDYNVIAKATGLASTPLTITVNPLAITITSSLTPNNAVPKNTVGDYTATVTGIVLGASGVDPSAKVDFEWKANVGTDPIKQTDPTMAKYTTPTAAGKAFLITARSLNDGSTTGSLSQTTVTP